VPEENEPPPSKNTRKGGKRRNAKRSFMKKSVESHKERGSQSASTEGGHYRRKNGKDIGWTPLKGLENRGAKERDQLEAGGKIQITDLSFGEIYKRYTIKGIGGRFKRNRLCENALRAGGRKLKKQKSTASMTEGKPIEHGK